MLMRIAIAHRSQSNCVCGVLKEEQKKNTPDQLTDLRDH